MEGSRKRKASNATPTQAEGSASKKLRLLNNAAAPKSQVQEVGRKIVEQLRNASDKTGRLIAVEFLELPDEEDLPEYYEIIKLPVALETIEEKVKRDEYPTVTAIESDLKRMVQNAKEFNDPKSIIYEDSERIRKLVFNFMKTNNPEYKTNPNYTATPTPIPRGSAAPVQNGGPVKSEEAPESVQVKLKTKQSSVPRSSEADRKSSVAPSAATGEDEEGDDDNDNEGAGEDLDFTGKSFQEAQQMIVSFFLNYTDPEGLEIYSPFGNLPTRRLEDYYKIIRHPVSLKSVQKRTKGIHGRAPPTNVTDFKTWGAFEEEMSFIWRNAKEYNEDGSDMYNLADEFQEHFKTVVAEAKEKIEEPGQRLKLGGPKPKVMLNLGQQSRGSPAAPGVSVDNEALARQRQMVQAGVNGGQSRIAPAMNGSAQAFGADLQRPTSSANSGSPMPAGIKAEKASTQSPAPPNGAPLGMMNGMMPPPLLRPTSGSPYPVQPPQQTYFPVPVNLPPTQLRTYPKEAALLPNVTITTHPHLKLANPFSLSIGPHDTLSHQSTTTTLPSSHYFLQINATISKQLSMARPYKMFVTVNGSRLTQRDTQFHADSGKRTHVYEPSLMQGVNRIEVEVAAAEEKAEEKEGSGGAKKGLDVEKVTIFANLMR